MMVFLKKRFSNKAPPQVPAVLMLGVISQVGQILLLRELLMVFKGSELSIGLILAAWLIWVGVGSRLGVILAGRTARPRFFILLNSAAVLLVLPTTIFAIRVLRSFFPVSPGVFLSLADIAVSSLILAAPLCLILGVQFVLLARIWREGDRLEDTSGAGKTYAGEAAGNMIGGLVFTFFIVRYFNSFQAAALTGILLLGSALILAGTERHSGRSFPVGVSFILLLFLLAFFAVITMPLFESLDNLAYRLQWQVFYPDHELVEIRQSRHGTITVLRREDQYSFFQSGHLVFSSAAPDAAFPGLEEQEAVEFAHMVMVQHRRPEKVLLIGGGLRGLLGEMLKHPVSGIDYIELDRELTGVATPYLPPGTRAALADPRIRLIHTDGRLFVKTAEESYDLIVVDVPDPATAVLNRYYTVDFFEEACSRLKPGGVLIIGALSTADLRGVAIANRNAAIYHSLNRVFERVLPAGERFIYYFAGNDPGQISLDPQLLQDRYLERNIETEGFSSLHYYALLEETRLRRVNWVIRNHGRSRDSYRSGPGMGPLSPAPLEDQESREGDLPPVDEAYFINSDLRPIGFFYTLMFWEDLTRLDRGRILTFLLDFRLSWLLPLFLAPPMVVAAMRFSRRGVKNKRHLIIALLFAVFTTGLSTMALQVALLFSFQSVYGFIYEMVGLILALFMAGLSAGAFFVIRRVQGRANLNLLASIQLAIALFALLTTAVLPLIAVVRDPGVVFFLFALLTFSAGFINGVNYPVSTACCRVLQGGAERSAGIVYGVELFGASGGAALAGVVLAPILGVTACSLLAALANGAAFLAIFICRVVNNEGD